MDTFCLASQNIRKGYKIKLNKENLYSYAVEISKDNISSVVTIDKFVAIGYEYETVREALQIAYDEIKQKRGGNANEKNF